jgi:hypothetical protein
MVGVRRNAGNLQWRSPPVHHFFARSGDLSASRRRLSLLHRWQGGNQPTEERVHLFGGFAFGFVLRRGLPGRETVRVSGNEKPPATVAEQIATGSIAASAQRVVSGRFQDTLHRAAVPLILVRRDIGLPERVSRLPIFGRQRYAITDYLRLWRSVPNRRSQRAKARAAFLWDVWPFARRTTDERASANYVAQDRCGKTVPRIASVVRVGGSRAF